MKPIFLFNIITRDPIPFCRCIFISLSQKHYSYDYLLATLRNTKRTFFLWKWAKESMEIFLTRRGIIPTSIPIYPASDMVTCGFNHC